MLWRRRLPHWVPKDSVVFVTWRLARTLPKPQPKILINEPDPHKAFELWDRELDRTTEGPHWLRNPDVSALCVEALLYGENVRRSYVLFAWVIMPNHIHIVLKPHEALPEVIRWIKGSTAVRANRLLNRTGQPFWQREYFDRWIRTSDDLTSTIGYAEANPVNAGLVDSAENWPWSSASSKDTGGETAGAPGAVASAGFD
jgi:putative DNA methylase